MHCKSTSLAWPTDWKSCPLCRSREANRWTPSTAYMKTSSESSAAIFMMAGKVRKSVRITLRRPGKDCDACTETAENVDSYRREEFV